MFARRFVKSVRAGPRPDVESLLGPVWVKSQTHYGCSFGQDPAVKSRPGGLHRGRTQAESRRRKS